MFSIITTILSFIPGFTKIIQSWVTARANVELAKINGRTAVGSAAVDAAAKEADGRARTWGVIGASQLLTLLVIFLALPIGLYEWKEVVVDKIIGPGCIWLTNLCWVGTTDPIKDTMVASWINVIIGSLFGSSSVLAVAQLWWTTKP